MMWKTVITLALCGGLAGCGSLPKPDELIGAAAPTVSLGVDDQTNTFRVLTPPEASCVKSGLDINGCFEVGKNRVAFVRFNLQASDGWQFQRMRICLGQSEPGANCNLTPWNRLEFIAATARDSEYVLANSEGYMDLRLLGEDLETYLLATQNLYEQWWYYQVQVCPSGTPVGNDANDPNCLWNEDPPIKNKGRRLR